MVEEKYTTFWRYYRNPCEAAKEPEVCYWDPTWVRFWRKLYVLGIRKDLDCLGPICKSLRAKQIFSDDNHWGIIPKPVWDFHHLYCVRFKWLWAKERPLEWTVLLEVRFENLKQAMDRLRGFQPNTKPWGTLSTLMRKQDFLEKCYWILIWQTWLSEGQRLPGQIRAKQTLLQRNLTGCW